MVDRTGVSDYLKLPFLTVACLIVSAFAASSANAFTQTISDIEDPSVTAKVIGLDVEATDGGHAEHGFHLSPSFILSAFDFDHSLSGKTDASLTEAQFPKLIVQRDPTVVSLAGKLATGKAEGYEQYSDLEHCQGGRTTTASPLLDVSLTNFYQSGSAQATGNPEASLTTGNLDPWGTACFGSLPAKATRVETFLEPTTTELMVSGTMWNTDLKPKWTPAVGSLTTTKNACTPEYCDFTISGANKNTASFTESTVTAGAGSADTKFTLHIRLEYPPAGPTPEEPATAPNTRITKAPRKIIKTRSGKAKVAFRFKSTGPKGTKFKCRLDKGRFAKCSSGFKRKVATGKHRFAVASVYDGMTDKTPAVHKWKVKKAKRQTRR